MNKPTSIKKPSKGTWTDAAGLGKERVPVTGCTSPDYFEQEVGHIFKKSWLCAGREQEIPEIGDFIVKEYKAMKTSILVVRGRDSKVRAFHNVCSHRCNKLKWDSSGHSARLTCKFHGWTYSLDGKLMSVPDEDQFFDLDKSSYGLAEISAEVWEGFIFINLDPNPGQSLEDYMPNFYHGLKGYPFHEMTRCYAWQLELNCNWKILKDAFSEIYHVPFVHNLSVADTFANKSRPMAHGVHFDVFQNELRMSFWGNPDYVPPAATAVTYKHGPSIVKRGDDASDLPEFMNPTKIPNWAGDLMQVFPCFHITLTANSYIYLNYLPVSVDKMLWELRYYARPAKTHAERFSEEYAAIALRDSILEDTRTVEYTQSVLSSGAKTHFTFSDQEALVRGHHEMTQRWAGPYPDPK